MDTTLGLGDNGCPKVEDDADRCMNCCVPSISVALSCGCAVIALGLKGLRKSAGNDAEECKDCSLTLSPPPIPSSVITDLGVSSVVLAKASGDCDKDFLAGLICTTPGLGENPFVRTVADGCKNLGVRSWPFD